MSNHILCVMNGTILVVHNKTWKISIFHLKSTFYMPSLCIHLTLTVLLCRITQNIFWVFFLGKFLSFQHKNFMMAAWFELRTPWVKGIDEEHLTIPLPFLTVRIKWRFVQKLPSWGKGHWGPFVRSTPAKKLFHGMMIHS